MGHIGHLPVAVHRALDEKTLREERDRAQIGLRHSEARYPRLAGNLSYGICRCDLDGKFLEVNEAMVKMLGYASREELLGVNLRVTFFKILAIARKIVGATGPAGFSRPHRNRMETEGRHNSEGPAQRTRSHGEQGEWTSMKYHRGCHQTAPVGGSSASAGGSRSTDRAG